MPFPLHQATAINIDVSISAKSPRRATQRHAHSTDSITVCANLQLRNITFSSDFAWLGLESWKDSPRESQSRLSRQHDTLLELAISHQTAIHL